MLPEDRLEASKNHLCRHLVDLLVAPLALVVLQEPTDQRRVHGRRLRVLLLCQAIQKRESVGEDVDAEDFVALLSALLEYIVEGILEREATHTEVLLLGHGHYSRIEEPDLNQQVGALELEGEVTMVICSIEQHILNH